MRLPNGNLLLRASPSGPPVEFAPWQGVDALTQTEWAIDFLDGSDLPSSTGSPASPLKTGAEFTRRTWGRGITNFTTLTLLNDCPDPNTDYLFWRSPALLAGAFFRIVGTPTTLAAGTLTAVTMGTPNVSQTTIQASVDLSGLVGKRCRITAATAATVGTVFYVELANAGTYTISAPVFVDTSVASTWQSSTVQTLTIGDAFVVEELTQAPSMHIDPWGLANTLGAPNGRLVGLTGLRTGQPNRLDDLVLGTQAMVCSFGNVFNNGQIIWGYASEGLAGSTGCRFQNDFNAQALAGVPSFFSCSFNGNLSIHSPDTWINFNSNNSIRNGKVQLDHEGRIQVNGLCIHQWGVLSGIGAALHIQEGCFANIGAVLWGTSTAANTYGIRVDAYGGGVYASGAKPTISGALAPGKDVEVGGVSLAYADVPGLSANAANFAALVAKN